MNKTWTRLHTFAAGAVLIVLANAVALGGVFLNRSGEPESRATLTERELPLSYDSLNPRENSGLALRLDWRVDDDDERAGFGYSGYGMQPAWLDADRMAALGFAVPPGNAAGELPAEARERYVRQLRRQVLVVLEFDGPAWRRALARAQAATARHAAAAAANPGSAEFAERAKSAGEQFALEQNGHSRLFAIDAGLDAATLRARYPDRSRHVILRATVRPSVVGNEQRRYRLGGYLDGIAIDRINVPFALRPPLEALRNVARSAAEERPPRYEVRLATGQRLEPWIEQIAPLPARTAR